MPSVFNSNYTPVVGDALLIAGRLQTVIASFGTQLTSGRQLCLQDKASKQQGTGFYNPKGGIVASATGNALFTAAAAGGNTGTGVIASTAILNGGGFDSSRGAYTITFASAMDGFEETWTTWSVTDASSVVVPSYDANLASIQFPSNTPITLTLATAPVPGSKTGTLSGPFSGATGLYCVLGWGTPVNVSGGQASFLAAGDTFQDGTCIFANLVNGSPTVSLVSPVAGVTAGLAQWPGWPNPIPLSLQACAAVVLGSQFVSPQAITFMGISVTISGAPAAGDSFVLTPYSS